MRQLSVFQHEQFGDVQVIDFEGEIYFNPDMVAKALGYKDADSMLRVFETIPQEDMALYVRHFTYQELSKLHLKGGVKQNQGVNWSANGKRFLTEPGLFFLLNRSEKPNAYPFQKWVNTQVLPQLRKGGAFQLTAQNQPLARIESQLLAMAKQQQEIKDQLSEIKQEISKSQAFPDEAIFQSEFITLILSIFWALHKDHHLSREQLEKLVALFENHLEKQKAVQTPAQKKSGYTTQEKADLKRAALILRDDFKLSPLEIAARFNEDGAETLSGHGEWTATKVKRLLAS